MNAKEIFDKAYSSLNVQEKKILSLLTSEVTKEEISSFLSTYDIDSQKASSSFLINILLEKYEFDVSENPIIPRIKGLKDYFKFHNITTMSKINKNETIVDIDLYLKIKNTQEIRGFSSKDNMLDESKFVKFAGKKYSFQILNSAYIAKDGFKIPSEKKLIDLLYLKLFFSITYINSYQNALPYLYDICKYGNDLEISSDLRKILARKKFRNKLGSVKRWITGASK